MGFLLLTLIILRDQIQVEMCEVFLVCLIAVASSTLAYLLVGPLFGLSFSKEADEVVEIPHLHDRSLLLVKVIFSIQIAENEEVMQSTDLFQATFQSPREYLT